MKKSLWVLLPAILILSGCTETQQAALIGTLSGSTIGALSGKKEDRTRNALLGGGVGFLGGSLYGKHKEANRLKKENAVLRRELETYEMRRELERLQEENERLRKRTNDNGRKIGVLGL